MRLNRTLRLGETSGTNETDEVRGLFEWDAPDDDFREGSPVFDDRGQVVALCTRSATTESAASVVHRPHAALADAEMLTALWSGQPSKQWFGYARKDRASDAAIPPAQGQPSPSTH